MLTIYTDGACSKNGYAGSSGGYGVVAVDDENIIELRSKRSDGETTNNREELKAILYAMIKYGRTPNEIPTVYSDSAYAINTLTQWMYGWARNGWLKSDNRTPENLDLIQPYYDLVEKGYKINLVKVKGHAGNKWNEMADALATGKMKGDNSLDLRHF